MAIKAKRLGYDDEWSRPLAVDEDGNIYCDIGCGMDELGTAWCSTTADGEPIDTVTLEFEDNND